MSENLKIIRFGIDPIKVESKKREEAENTSFLTKFWDKRKSSFSSFFSLALFLFLSFSPDLPSFASPFFVFFSVFSCLPLVLPFHLSSHIPD